MKKRILVSDYDDTLFSNDEEMKSITQKIKKFQENGNIFVISTSRSWKSIKQEIDQYQIPYDYVCSNTGAGIFDKNGIQLYANYITKEQKEKVESILKKYDKDNVAVTRYGIQEEQEENSNRIVGYKIKGNLDTLEKLKDELLPVCSDFQIILKKQDGKLFLNNLANTKEKGIEYLCELFPLHNYEIVTVGDDDVDYNMIKQYDGYRMENSSKLLVNNIMKSVHSVVELMNF